MTIDSTTAAMLETVLAAAEANVRSDAAYYVVAVDLAHVKRLQKHLTLLRPGWGTDLPIVVTTVTNKLVPYDPVSGTLGKISAEYTFIDHVTIEHFE
jgi:hypothetical protein